MKKIIVNGGKRLEGEIRVGGSKNAALPIIFACFLINGVSEIDNLPHIGDVQIALDILRSFGGRVWRCEGKTYIDTTRLSYRAPDPKLASKIRASTYLLGGCLSRFGRCPIPNFGGCNFSPRPIDMHIDACLSLGARLCDGAVVCDRLRGADISFRLPSVGATVNAILLAASAEGETHISGCAREPHIDSLIDFLLSCGADIKREDRELCIVGRELHGGSISIIGDMIEAGSYLVLSLMSGGGITVNNCPTDHMQSFLDGLCDLGATYSVSGSSISAELLYPKYSSVTTSPYPGFPTDLQPIIAPLMAFGAGGEITDTVWRDRFGYLASLSHFGIVSDTRSGRAKIYPSTIQSGRSCAPDLRGGMACLITALSATGESEISDLDIILRGYEDLENKLRTLGADIKIIDT